VTKEEFYKRSEMRKTHKAKQFQRNEQGPSLTREVSDKCLVILVFVLWHSCQTTAYLLHVDMKMNSLW
jgi:hypothetical protein